MPNILDARPQTASKITPLGQFVTKLAHDQSFHRAYLDDPEAVIADSDLSAEEAVALRANDWQRIVALVGPGDRDPKKHPGGGGV